MNYIKKSIAFTCVLIACTLVGKAQDASWFKDVSVQLGFSVVHAGAVIGLDVNNDDYPDILTLGSPWKLYINSDDPNSSDPADRIFVDATANSGLDAIELKDMGGAADFNNDGNIDLVTNRWYHTQKPDFTPNPDDGSRLHLLLGDGHGHFTLKSNSGLEDLGPMAGVGLPMLDYNRDGNLDLFVPNHYVGWFNQTGPSFLMKGNGDGTFTNVTVAAGINISQVDPSKPWLNPPPTYRAMFGANMSDWNNDCYPDIFTAPYESSGYPDLDWNNDQFVTKADTGNSVGYGQLYKNNGDGTFTDVAVTANYNTHFMWGGYDQGMVPWAAMPCDYDNDGDIDYLVLEVHGGSLTTTEGRTSIFTNQGPANNYRLEPELSRIVRKSPQSRSHGDHNGFWMDFDNDGWADLIVGDAVYVPATDRMFFCRQNPTTHIFTDITKELGFIAGTLPATISDRIRRPSVMIPIDYDMDGDDDIVKTAYNGDDSLNFLVLRNDVANKNHYIQIKLVAPGGVNKSCIGAKVSVKAGGMKQTREIYGDQGSFTNQYPFTLNFGLGTSTTTVDSIIVQWPDGSCSHTVLTNVPADKFIYIDKNGINDVPKLNAQNIFEVYPNPNSSDYLNVSFGTTTLEPTIEIYNGLGQKIITYQASGVSNIFHVPVKDLSTGIYWVRVKVGDNLQQVNAKSFFKQNK